MEENRIPDKDYEDGDDWYEGDPEDDYWEQNDPWDDQDYFSDVTPLTLKEKLVEIWYRIRSYLPLPYFVRCSSCHKIRGLSLRCIRPKVIEDWHDYFCSQECKDNWLPF